MVNKIMLTEQLAFCTVRIETISSNGTKSMGTGFLYKLCEDNNGVHIPVIVTNKHVVRNADKGKIRFTLQNSEGLPDLKKHYQCEIESFEKGWKYHPDPDIDVCVMPIGAILNHIKSEGKRVYSIFLNRELLPKDEDLNDMFCMDDIAMVGYPNGIWDQVNNLPVFRKGVTATHPKYDWNGKKEFLIDCACFPGSSGSPVFLINIGGYQSRDSYNLGKTRIKLLGILYAGPVYEATGEIKIVNVPVVHRPLVLSAIPNNLGVVIKSNVLNDFDQLFPDKHLTD